MFESRWMRLFALFMAVSAILEAGKEDNPWTVWGHGFGAVMWLGFAILKSPLGTYRKARLRENIRGMFGEANARSEER